MAKIKDILFDFINLWAKEHEIYSIQGTVKSVDEQKRICTVTPSDGGGDIIDVSLEAEFTIDSNGNPVSSTSKGFFVVPATGSLVIVTFTDKVNGFLSAYTTIDKVISKQAEWIFNDGGNGGLTKLQELTDRLNDLEDLFSQLKTDFNGWTPAPTDGGLALKTILLSGYLTKTIPNSQVSDFENTKIKH